MPELSPCQLTFTVVEKSGIIDLPQVGVAGCSPLSRRRRRSGRGLFPRKLVGFGLLQKLSWEHINAQPSDLWRRSHRAGYLMVIQVRLLRFSVLPSGLHYPQLCVKLKMLEQGTEHRLYLKCMKQ